MRRLSTAVAALLALALPATVAAGELRSERLLAPAEACPGSEALEAPVARQVAAMECLVRYARAQAGLPPLRKSRLLDRAAALKADEDVRCGEFSHTPCGRPFLHVFERAGYVRPAGGWSVGENLAWGSGSASTPRAIMLLWLDSPGHRRNLLSQDWQEFGLARIAPDAFLSRPDAVIWVNAFGHR